MKMICLSRLIYFTNNKKNNSKSNVNGNSSLAIRGKPKSCNSLGKAENIYNYYNTQTSPKRSPSNISSSKNSSYNSYNNKNNKSIMKSGAGDRGSFRSSPLMNSSSGMETLSASNMTSTPAVADSSRLLEGYTKLRTVDVSSLPDVVLDKILSKLTDEDIRRLYQVSKEWKNVILRRPGVNRLRGELVQKIRQNKENIIKGNQNLVGTDVCRRRNDRIADNNSNGKPGSRRVLNDHSNQWINSSTHNSSNANPNKGFSPINSSTPTSRSSRQPFQEWELAEKNLKDGQRLFRCEKCYGPVASPVPGKDEDERSYGTGISASKCRLTSRMSSIEEPTRNCRERKKQRSLIKSSPASFSNTHVDICSLTDLATLLYISKSTPEVATSDKLSSKEESLLPNSSPAVVTFPNTGIDLPINSNNSGSLNCNVSNINFDYTGSTSSIFKTPSSPMTNYNTNDTCSPKFSNRSLGGGDSAMSQNLSDSCFSMSYINSSDELCSSHLQGSTIYSPEHIRNSSRGETSKPNQSESMQTCSADNLLKQAVSYSLKAKVNLNNWSHNSQSVLKKGEEKNFEGPNTSEFRIPADFVDFSTVNRGLDSMLDSQQYSDNSNSNISKSMKSSSYSVLREASKTGSSLIQSPSCQFSQDSSMKFQSTNSINLFPKTPFDMYPLTVSGNLMDSSSNLNTSIVLECPDCSYRFCSNCEENEHVGRSCRVIDSDSFRYESNDEPLVVSSPFNNSGPNSISSSSMGSKGNGKSSAKEESKKRLRRIARK